MALFGNDGDSSIDAPQSKLEPGDLFDGWLIEAHLGRGAMGSVFRAAHQEKGLSAALKILPEQADRELFGRFRREVQVMGRLSHPALARILQEELTHDPPYFAMEILEGGDLLKRIHASGGSGLPPTFVTRLGLLLAEGLAAAHGEGILHRDIKPSNVLFAAHDQPKLADFGLAKAVDMTSLTRDFGLRGTLAYMAPEVLQGNPESAQSDLYQLGVTLYQAATGELPYEFEVIHRVLAGGQLPALPASTKRNLTPRLHAALSALLAPDPGRRPKSARDAAALFQPRVTGATSIQTKVLQRPPMPTRAPVSRIQAHARSLAIGTIGALLASAALLVFREPATESRPAASSSEPASSTRRPEAAPVEAAGNPAAGASDEGAKLLREVEQSLVAERSLEAAIETWKQKGGSAEWRAKVFAVNVGSIVKARFRFALSSSRALGKAAGDPARPVIWLEVDSARNRQRLGQPLPEGDSSGSYSVAVETGRLREGFNRFVLAGGKLDGGSAVSSASLEFERSTVFPRRIISGADRLESAACPSFSKQLKEANVLCKTANYSASIGLARTILARSPDCGEAKVVISRAFLRIAEIRKESETAGMLASWSLLTVSGEIDVIPSPELVDQSDRLLDEVAGLYPRWDRVWHEYGDHLERRRDWAGALRAGRWRVALGAWAPDTWEGLASYQLGDALRSPARTRGEGWRAGLLAGLSHAEHASRLREKAQTVSGEGDLVRGRILELLGRLPQAKEALERAARSPNIAGEARRALASLGRGRQTTR